MKTFRLIISSPEGDIFDGEAVNLSVRGIDGDLAVMAGHIPFITSLKPCECRIELPDGSKKAGDVKGGLLSVADDKTILLTDSFKW